MNSEEIIKQIRESVEKQAAAGQMTPEVAFIFLQLETISWLEAIHKELSDLPAQV
jgi:hypothetical protein